ncbi:hypothetical protein L9F63_016425, partial [Diploptera punctata]
NVKSHLPKMIYHLNPKEIMWMSLIMYVQVINAALFIYLLSLLKVRREQTNLYLQCHVDEPEVHLGSVVLGRHLEDAVVEFDLTYLLELNFIQGSFHHLQRLLNTF